MIKMREQDFVNYIKVWMLENGKEDNEFLKTDYFAEKLLEKALKEDVDGVIVEDNDLFLIGKYYHTIRLNKELSKTGESEFIKFIAYGFGYKEQGTGINDGDLYDYTEFDFLVV